jgi:hypothetical protein
MFRNRYDNRRKSCAQKSLLQSTTDNTTKECREHHFGSNGRCSNCQMRSDYYFDAMRKLSKWTKKERTNPSSNYEEIVESYQCKPHLHVIMTTTITIPNDNPIRQLYDMESY